MVRSSQALKLVALGGRVVVVVVNWDGGGSFSFWTTIETYPGRLSVETFVEEGSMVMFATAAYCQQLVFHEIYGTKVDIDPVVDDVNSNQISCCGNRFESLWFAGAFLFPPYLRANSVGGKTLDVPLCFKSCRFYRIFVLEEGALNRTPKIIWKIKRFKYWNFYKRNPEVLTFLKRFKRNSSGKHWIFGRLGLKIGATKR